MAVKRKFSRIRTLDSDEDITPVKKRPRPIPDSQSSQDTIIIDDDEPPATNGPSTSNGQPMTNGYQQPQQPFKTYVEKVQFLQEAFPNLPKNVSCEGLVCVVLHVVCCFSKWICDFNDT